MNLVCGKEDWKVWDVDVCVPSRGGPNTLALDPRPWRMIMV